MPLASMKAPSVTTDIVETRGDGQPVTTKDPATILKNRDCRWGSQGTSLGQLSCHFVYPQNEFVAGDLPRGEPTMADRGLYEYPV